MSGSNRDKKRVYIGRISNRTRVGDLEDTFGHYGEIVSCELKHGFGFVEYVDSRDAEDAINALDSTHLDGSRIIVEFSKGPKPRNTFTKPAFSKKSPPERSEYRVAVDGVPKGMSWQDLKDEFRSAGEVVFADIFADRNDRGRTKGIVEFKTKTGMDQAISDFDGTEIRGSKIYVTQEEVVKKDRGDRDRDSRSPPSRRYRDRSPRRDRRYNSRRSRSPRRRSRSPPRKRSRSDRDRNSSRSDRDRSDRSDRDRSDRDRSDRNRSDRDRSDRDRSERDRSDRSDSESPRGKKRARSPDTREKKLKDSKDRSPRDEKQSRESRRSPSPKRRRSSRDNGGSKDKDNKDSKERDSKRSRSGERRRSSPDREKDRERDREASPAESRSPSPAKANEDEKVSPRSSPERAQSADRDD